MRYVFSILVLFFSLSAKAQVRLREVWKFEDHTNGKKSVVRPMLTKDQIFLPFLSIRIPMRALDSLCDYANYHDSVLGLKQIPIPISLSIKGIDILYAKSIKFSEGKDSTVVYVFLGNRKDQFSESSCLKYFFIRGVGIFFSIDLRNSSDDYFRLHNTATRIFYSKSYSALIEKLRES